MGLAAYPDEPPKYLTKKKIIKNQSKFKDCTVQLTEDRILVKPKRKATLEIRFLKINSMRIFEKNDGFEIYAYNMIYKFYNNAKSKPATDKLINDIKYELDKLIKKYRF